MLGVSGDAPGRLVMPGSRSYLEQASLSATSPAGSSTDSPRGHAGARYLRKTGSTFRTGCAVQPTSILMSGLLALAASRTPPPTAVTVPNSSRIERCADGAHHAEIELTLARPSMDRPFLVRIERYRLQDHATTSSRRPSLLLSTRPVTPFGLWNSRPSDYLRSDDAWHGLGLQLEETRHATHYDVEIIIDFDPAVEDRTGQGNCTITLLDV